MIPIRCAFVVAVLAASSCRPPAQQEDPEPRRDFFDKRIPSAPVQGNPPGDALESDGLHYQVLRPGYGTRHPQPDSIVLIHYAGWKADGTLFDASYRKGTPKLVQLKDAIHGWSLAVRRMVVGERTRFWIPADEAYGDEPEDPRLPAGDLIFEIELLRIPRF